MTEGESNEELPVAANRRRKGLSRLTRAFLWLGASLLVLLVLAGAGVGILLHRAQPLLRASLIDTLQERFQSRVELDDLHVSIVDGFKIEGSGLRIWLPAEAVQAQTEMQAGKKAVEKAEPAAQEQWRTEPWIVVDKLHFHAGWRILPGKPIVVSVIHVEGLRVLLPPAGQRPGISGTPNAKSPEKPSQLATQNGARPVSQPQPASRPSLFKVPEIQIQRIECQDAQLVIERKPEPGKPAKAPLEFEFKKVTVIPDGHGGPMAFAVDMTNAKPVGIIHSTGKAGPWAPGDPGALPVEGDYSFDHADLSTIKGIAGILSSTGHYEGTLRKIEADGETQTPDFRLERVSKSSGLPLTTHFHAVVDGTNGDTWLQPVDAMLGRTHIVARGQVVRAEDSEGHKHGHNITLQVTVDRGRIEDILHISAQADKPFITGNLELDTSFNLSAGDNKVLDKLQLDGQFHLSQARFSNATMQGRIEQLSMRGQGKPDEVKSTDPESIFSEMGGHFKLGGGTLQLPDLQYEVPGAEIVAHGNYGMEGGTLDFVGDARMDASISQMVGGWKGLLLKPVDRYLRKNGAGTDVPIKVSGTRAQPSFGVEFNRLGKTEEAAPPQGPS
jgi:hypothetical protein